VDLSPLWQLVVDPAVEKIVHAGEQDFELCHLCTGQPPANIFDVQTAAGLAGLPYPLSYAKLVLAVTGTRVGKAETVSDWSRRPLTQSQLRYAAEDVRHLGAIEADLRQRLQKRGRLQWLREEMRPLETASRYARDAADAWRRVRGASGLSRRGLAVLRELAVWRDAAAQRADVPPRTFLKDEVLVAVARHPPDSAGALRNVRGMPNPVANRCGREIMDAVARGRAASPADAPQADGSAEERPEDRMLADLASAVGQGLCLAGHVAHTLLASRGDYMDLVRAVAAGGAKAGEDQAAAPAGGEAEGVRLLAGWRREFAGDAVRAVIEGRASIAVAGGPRRPRVEVGAIR
jgi:ribonuclease D